SPQFDTLTVAYVLLPTGCWPNISVSVLMPIRDAAKAGDDSAATTTVARRAKARSDGMGRAPTAQDYAHIGDARIIAASRPGSVQPARLRRALQIALELAEHRTDFPDRPFEVVARDVERRRDAHDGAVGVLRQDAAGEQAVDDRARAWVARVDFDADDKTPAGA